MKRRERPQTGRGGTAGVSSRVRSVAGADGFSVKPTTKLEASNRFRFHTAAQRWAAEMEAETPPLTGSDRQTGCFHFGNNHRSLPGLGPRWSVRKPDKKAAIVAGAVGIGLAAPKFPAGYFPYCASPAGGRQHGAGGPCCFTAPAKIMGATGAANQTSPRFKLLRAASIGEAAFLFPSAPAPRGEQAKAADSLPKCNGAAL